MIASHFEKFLGTTLSECFSRSEDTPVADCCSFFYRSSAAFPQPGRVDGPVIDMNRMSRLGKASSKPSEALMGAVTGKFGMRGAVGDLLHPPRLYRSDFQHPTKSEGCTEDKNMLAN